jgi:hypothetical protein
MTGSGGAAPLRHSDAMIKTTIGKIDATFMVVRRRGVQVFIACFCVVKYQEHTALSSFYDTPDAGQNRYQGRALT